MRSLRRFWYGLRRLVGLHQSAGEHHELDEELQDFVEREVEARMARGQAPDDARRAARAVVGSRAAVADDVDDLGWDAPIRATWQDLRFGIRLMRRSPLFTSVAIAVLALGIGVNTALFSIVNTLFFRPLPVHAPEELVYVYSANRAGQAVPFLNPEELDHLTERGSALGQFSEHWQLSQPLSVGDETESVFGEWVESAYFEILGVRPLLGRVLGAAEDDPATTERAIVISHDFWKQVFKADPAAVGQRVRLRSLHYTVVGVMPDGFTGVTDPWRPSQFWITFQQSREGRRDGAGTGIGRLAPGVTIGQLTAFMRSTMPELFEKRRQRALALGIPPTNLYAPQFPRVYAAKDVRTPFAPDAAVISPAMLAAVVTVVALVLLIAAANIAGLLLARGVTRTGEVAVRRALGAGSVRLARQLLTETMVLCLAGGVFGLGLAWNVLALFRASAPSTLTLDVSLDWRVLFFAAAACLLTGLLVGLAPARQALRVNVLEALGGGLVGARQTRARLRHWIVVPQIALSLLLLVVAGVHLRALLSVETADLGYAVDDTRVFRVNRWAPTPEARVFSPGPRTAEEAAALQRAGMEAREREAAAWRAFNRAVLEKVGDVPGIQSYGLVSWMPLEAASSEAPVVVARGTERTAEARKVVASQGYFDAMHLQLRAGRSFDERDGYGGRQVTVISETVAAQLWPGGDAVGEMIAFAQTDATKAPAWLEVIGVVEEATPVLGKPGDSPMAYVPLLQQWQGYAPWLVVRDRPGASDAERGALTSAAKAAVIGADAFAEVTSVQTIAQMAGTFLYPRRVAAGVLAGAGLIGLLLAVIGLYGVVSYSVAQRLRELGIRATLGAGRRDLLVLVLREGTVAMVIGAAAGLLLAVLALRLTAGLIPGLPLVDVTSFVVVPVVLAAVVLLACYLPARRAASVDPLEVLRRAG